MEEKFKRIEEIGRLMPLEYCIDTFKSFHCFLMLKYQMNNILNTNQKTHPLNSYIIISPYIMFKKLWNVKSPKCGIMYRRKITIGKKS